MNEESLHLVPEASIFEQGNPALRKDANKTDERWASVKNHECVYCGRKMTLKACVRHIPFCSQKDKYKTLEHKKEDQPDFGAPQAQEKKAQAKKKEAPNLSS